MTRLTEKELQAVLATHEVVADTSTGTEEKRMLLHSSVPSEHAEQAALFVWANAHPVACVMYANVNGQYRQGQRPEPGMKAGIPDVFLPVARGGYHGLYIELKRKKGGVVFEAQKAWHERLRGQGYAVGLSYGADEAIAQVQAYLGEGEQ